MNTGPGQGARGPSSLPNWWPADPRHTSSTTSDVMSQLCRVCGEPAAGFHFGAFTCEGCKSFFGRTYNNLGSISECKNNGECVINKKNRTSCKACRLRKCLVVGMSKSGSRYGRRSNWFKIHCLLQEQHQQHHHHHQHHHHQQQQQQQQHVQPAGLLGMGLQQQFQQHLQQQQHQRSAAAAGRPSLEPGRTSPPPPPPPPPPLPWADVKHHLRLDADNNNSVAGDLNKDGGGRLSAAAAAVAVAQAVARPDVLRWPSPFFPAFPFPSAAPFFLAMQPQALHGALRSPRSPPSGSSAVPAPAPAVAEDDDGEDDDDEDEPHGPLSAGRVAFRRDLLPPVQESPMDLSVSAPSPPRSRSPSPELADGPRPTDRCRQRRRQRRRRRRRRREPSGDRRASDVCTDAARDTSSGSTGSESEDGPGGTGADGRPARHAPLDLTCDRSS